MPYQSVNPFNGQTLQTFPEITDVRLEAALATATACYAKWRLTSFAERAKIVAKAAAILHERVDDFARPMTLEMGKRISEARGEVEFSSNILAYYAQHAERFLAPVKLHPKFGEAHMESSPLGLIFGVEPWNFPYYQLARIAGPHLMAGNVLLVKHAGCVPQCALAFERLWIEAGGPVGLYTNLLISHDQSDQVVDDPRIKGVALTGSVAAGRSIAARAGKNLKVSSMELGAATPSSCWRMLTLSPRSNGRSGAGCTTPVRPAARPSASSSWRALRTPSWRNSGRRSPPSPRATRWTRRRPSDPCRRNQRSRIS
jgi:succinate-semialdehyde dehydrogenase/glutarate-semialdehyde dehydrogenase